MLLILNVSFEFYEYLDLFINYGKLNICLLIVYCLFFLKDNGFIGFMFFDEFFKYLELFVFDFNCFLVIVGDFNYYMDDNFD